jgi:hypothetical protein
MASRVVSGYRRSGGFDEDLLLVGAFLSELSFFFIFESCFGIGNADGILYLINCIIPRRRLERVDN